MKIRNLIFQQAVGLEKSFSKGWHDYLLFAQYWGIIYIMHLFKIRAIVFFLLSISLVSYQSLASNLQLFMGGNTGKTALIQMAGNFSIFSATLELMKGIEKPVTNEYKLESVDRALESSTGASLGIELYPVQYISMDYVKKKQSPFRFFFFSLAGNYYQRNVKLYKSIQNTSFDDSVSIKSMGVMTGCGGNWVWDNGFSLKMGYEIYFPINDDISEVSLVEMPSQINDRSNIYFLMGFTFF